MNSACPHSNALPSPTPPPHPRPQLSTLSYDQIRSEVVGNRQQLAGCGIAEGSIQGFRAPFLNANPQVRQVLAGNQFLYDR